ncbi:MAG TPA: efflux RND transporter periplasmic adaptor subunit, partial [Bacteroidales bacterium]|nr:efflux RND transporter periplasmic adaptor subunit [Bacteroidales bacterium]
MKKKVLIIIGIVVVAAAAILAVKLLRKKETAYTFDTVKVERGTIANTVNATGTIQAIKTINVGTQVSGIIQNVYVDFNDNVKAGQLLAQLDKKPLQMQLDQTQATVDQSQAQLDYQEATYNRLKPLYEKKLIAQSDFDQAVYNYENSKASLKNAKSALLKAKINLDYATISSPIDGVVLNRAIEAGQTVASSFSTPTLFTIANDLTQMEVQTSVDEADIGKINDGQRVVFTVDAYPDIKFTGSVSQVRLQPVTTNNVVTYVVIINAPNPEKKLMPGMTATATIYVEEKENALTLSGKAIRFTPDAAWLKQMAANRKKSGTGTMHSAIAAQDQTNARINQGTSPSFQNQINTGTNQRTMSEGSLSSTVVNDPKSKTVWIRNDKGGIRPNRIKTGIDNGTNVEILTGLKEGDEVVVSMNSGTTKA